MSNRTLVTSPSSSTTSLDSTLSGSTIVQLPDERDAKTKTKTSSATTTTTTTVQYWGPVHQDRSHEPEFRDPDRDTDVFLAWEKRVGDGPGDTPGAQRERERVVLLGWHVGRGAQGVRVLRVHRHAQRGMYVGP